MKIIRIRIAALFAALQLIACGDENHAGVLSETESGQGFAGIILTSAGTPAARTNVYAVAPNFIAARDTFLDAATSDDAGAYNLKIREGEYVLLFEDKNSGELARSNVFVSRVSDSETVSIPAVTLSDGAKLSLDVAALDLNEGDTVCVEGTLFCERISADDVANGFTALRAVPEAAYETLKKITGENLETVSVGWNVQAGASYVTGLSLAQSSETLSRTLPDSLQGKFPTAIDSVPFPVWLSASETQPLLFDENGSVLPAKKVYAAGDSALYWAAFPKLDFSASTSQKILRFESENPAVFDLFRYAAHWDSLNAEGVWAGAKAFPNTRPDSITDFEVFSDGNLALSFWVNLEKGAFGNDSNVALFTAMKDSLGVSIQQTKFNSYQSVGVKLFVDSDSVVISDTTIYGSAKILDGAWHQLALLIRGQHISIMLDGKVLQDTDFDLAKGFGRLDAFVIGDNRLTGRIDEFKIYGGSKDTTFMRAAYELEKPGAGWSRE